MIQGSGRRPGLCRRGRTADPAWANRRLLLRGRERLSQAGLARIWNGCVDHDPTGQILSARIAKAQLRALCATAALGGHREDIGPRLWAFYSWCADANIPELTTLAETIETWWPGHRGVPVDRPDERPDRGHEQVDQAGETRFGFRNRDNYRRRVRLHCTRHIRRLSARKPTVPA
jgi:hypothetical protein